MKCREGQVTEKGWCLFPSIWHGWKWSLNMMLMHPSFFVRDLGWAYKKHLWWKKKQLQVVPGAELLSTVCCCCCWCRYQKLQLVLSCVGSTSALNYVAAWLIRWSWPGWGILLLWMDFTNGVHWNPLHWGLCAHHSPIFQAVVHDVALIGRLHKGAPGQEDWRRRDWANHQV